MHAKRDLPRLISIPDLSHWLWAIPVLLIVASLAIKQIDAFAPATDEFFSMFNAGWLVRGPYSPAEVVNSLREHSPDHAPLYFVLLSIWGKLAGTALASGRMLTVLTSLLCLAMVFRLAKDVVAPIAGLMAIVIVAGNAFFNFYLSNVRMYPLLVLFAGIVLWLYLRMVYQIKTPRLADYVALGVGTFCLISTHAFGLVFLTMLSIYHLLAAPKHRPWLAVSAVMLFAGLLFSPYLLAMLQDSGSVITSKEHVAVGSWDAILVWLNVMSNERPALLILPVVGLILGARSKRITLKPFMFMVVAYLLTMGALAETTPLILKDSMRHHLTSVLPFLLFVVAGLYGLFCLRKWLALVVVLWIAAGAEMQNEARWWDYIVLRSQVFTQPPTHILSRMALQETITPTILAYPYHTLYSDIGLAHRGNIDYSRRYHYFTQHGIDIGASRESADFKALAHGYAIVSPSLWLVHPNAPKWAEIVEEARELLEKLNYETCGARRVGADTVVIQYMWGLLDCRVPQAAAAYQTEIINYHFGDSSVDAPDHTLYLSDNWTARDFGIPLEPLRMSNQLLSDDWQKFAQVDLPLVHPERWRWFSIDIAEVPVVSYRLLLVLYHSESGERYNWLTSDRPLDMLPLADIVIP